MPKWMTVFFVFFLCTTLFTANAKSVDNIINHHINAMGGSEGLEGTGQITMRGEITSIDGKYSRLQVEFSADRMHKRKSSLTILPKQRSQGFTKIEVIEKERLENLLQDALYPQYSYSLMWYLTHGQKPEYVGEALLDGVKCYKLKLRLNGGFQLDYFVNTGNWYVIREVRQKLQGTGSSARNSGIIIDYSAYKSYKGHMLPYSVSITYSNNQKAVEGRFELIQMKDTCDTTSLPH
jgi:hypothetical protein